MALPKEPRQKMINLMYLVLTALLALNVSAEVIEAFKTVDTSLQSSNKSIQAGNATLFASLADRLKDPQTQKNAEIWAPVANNAKEQADQLDTYIENLKDSLKTMSGLKKDANGKPILNEKGEEEYKLDDLNASSRLMENLKGGTALDAKLNAFRNALLANPEVAKEFQKTLAVEANQSTTASFRMMPTVAAITLLSKYQNNVRNAESQVVTFAHNQIGKVKVVYNQFAAIVGQSSNYVMPGEKVTITAGVGAFSTDAKPVISIGGSPAAVDADGKAVRDFTADGAGEKSVMVHVSFTKPDGSTDSKDYPIKYTVGTPGGAAVMPTKMNVFYIGVDNPIKVGSPTGMEKTQVGISAGTVSGSGSERTVRVSAIGNVTVTVTADGKSYPFPFRVKRIPDPVFKVGDGKPRMATVVFKNQSFCRADLENFDFDLRYSIVGATVYFYGAGFTGVQQSTISGGDLGPIKALMAKCQPGSSVSFDNVRVSGPDGVRTIDGRTFQLF
jgi:gliding motility-associated protein GldM